MPFLDIGSMELVVVAVLALIVVGPRELPRLLKSVFGFVRYLQNIMGQVRQGVDELAREVEEEVDPFNDLRKAEGIHPSMSPEEITNKIMNNRGAGYDPSEELGPEEDKTPSDNATAQADQMTDKDSGDGENTIRRD